MFEEFRKYIVDFLSLSAKKRVSDEFSKSLLKTNISRGQITALMFIFLETMFLAATLIIKKGRALKPPTLSYISMYLLMIIVMIAFFFVFKLFSTNIERWKNTVNPVGVVFTAFILCWCAGISLLDQMSSKQIMVYLVAVIAVAVAPLFEPVVLFFIYLPVQTAFAVTLTAIHATSGSLFGNIGNSTAFVFVAWVIAAMRYKKQIIEFEDAKLIEEKSNELKKINAELQAANRKLEKLSQTDGLTGTLNRAMFDFMIKSEWERCKRQFIPMALLMIDIDFFKAFNDNYGHQAGDSCIRYVCRALSDCARRSQDIVARYGGEEFAVILPSMDSESAGAFAERLRKSVEKLEIPHEYSSVCEFVTISIGVYSVVPTNAMEIYEFIENADKALYAAKKSRNKVEIFA